MVKLHDMPLLVRNNARKNVTNFFVGPPI